MTLRNTFFLAMGATVLAACSNADAEPHSSAASNITHQDSGDITVLKTERLPGFIHVRDGAAVTTGEKPNAAGFDPQSCSPLASGKLDCTVEFERAFVVHAL